MCNGHAGAVRSRRDRSVVGPSPLSLPGAVRYGTVRYGNTSTGGYAALRCYVGFAAAVCTPVLTARLNLRDRVRL